MKKENNNLCCGVATPIPTNLKCSNIQRRNQIESIKIDLKGNCYDQDNRFLGIGKLVNNTLEIKQGIEKL